MQTVRIWIRRSYKDAVPFARSIFPLDSATGAYILSPPVRMSQIVEHIVLFKVRDDAEPPKVESMVNGLRGLVSIEKTIHLSSGVVHDLQSPSFSFTHILHGRFNTKEDLESYLQHPTHLSLLHETIHPVCDDIMMVDWIVDVDAPQVHPPPGAVIRVSFYKLKEGLKESEKDEVLKIVGGMDHFGSIDQLTYGENFAEAGKGYSIGSIAVFSGVKELESLDCKEIIEEQKEKVKDFVEDIFVVDYVVV